MNVKEMMRCRFEVYGPFGVIIKRFDIPERETHHKTYLQAYKFFCEWKNTGRRAWIRYRSN